jgi:hypothetical protein
MMELRADKILETFQSEFFIFPCPILKYMT